nr:MAG TPA: hypothetical protein [Caudoviricetes sp.]
MFIFFSKLSGHFDDVITFSDSKPITKKKRGCYPR